MSNLHFHPSRGNRLFMQVHQFDRNARLAKDALHRTKPSYSTRTGPLRCVCLHDTWPSYYGPKCELELDNSAVMVDKDLRDRRRYFFLDAMRRYDCFLVSGYSPTWDNS